MELVAKLQKVSRLENFLPLFLCGGALSVYENFSDIVKGDYQKLKASLLRTFSLNPFQAYEKLVTRTLEEGEAVDVYATDLKSLVMLICNEKEHNTSLVKCAFVRGLPSKIKQQLMAGCALTDMTFEDVVDKARFLLSTCVDHDIEMGVVAHARRITNIQCFACGKRGHVAKDCLKHVQMQNNNQVDGDVKCYRCGNYGHMAHKCVYRSQKNE